MSAKGAARRAGGPGKRGYEVINGNVMIPLRLEPRYHPRCRSCGCQHEPRHPSHELCSRCYRFRRLHDALVDFSRER